MPVHGEHLPNLSGIHGGESFFGFSEFKSGGTCNPTPCGLSSECCSSKASLKVILDRFTIGEAFMHQRNGRTVPISPAKPGLYSHSSSPLRLIDLRAGGRGQDEPLYLANSLEDGFRSAEPTGLWPGALLSLFSPCPQHRPRAWHSGPFGGS